MRLPRWTRRAAALLALAAVLVVPGSARAEHGTKTPVDAATEREVLERIRANEQAEPLLRAVERRDGARVEVSRSPSGENIAVDWYVGDRLALEFYVRGGDLAVQQAVQYNLGPPRWRAMSSVVTWPVTLVLVLLTIAALVDVRRPRSLHNVDVLALAASGLTLPLWTGLLTTNEQLVPRELGAGALAMTIPLVWLAGRCAWMLRQRVDVGEAIPLPSRVGRVLLALALIALAARWLANLYSRTMFDISQAGFIGAELVASGRLPWGDEAFRVVAGGDTYGLPAYVAYVPAVLGERWTGAPWELMVAATTVLLDAACALLLWHLVRRLASAEAAARALLVWAVHPLAVASVLVNPNDLLVALGVLGALAALDRPFLGGIALGVAAWVKFAPAAAAAALWGAARERGRFARWVAGGLLVSAGALVPVLLADDGWQHFWDATLGFQLGRHDDASVWGAYDLRAALPFVKVAVVLALGWVAWQSRRAMPALARCAAVACTLALVQLPLEHLGVPYMLWVLPGLLPLLVVRRTSNGGKA